MSFDGYYKGRGEQRSEDDVRLPDVDPEAMRSAEGYRASRELTAAVNVALTLGMPLLLTGEPGSGKSRLAHSVAWELNRVGPLEFTVKSDTQSRDLFYQFDTVGRFHAAQTKGAETDPRNFITFNALGLALLHAKPIDKLTAAPLSLPPERTGSHPGEPKQAVVLIDEIDKAPRDVPNDILNEIESLRFTIPEFGAADGQEVRIGLERDESPYRPIVIITSNSEKSLPEAFLRRCVYYNLPFPSFAADEGVADDEVTVEKIVESRLNARYQTDGARSLVDDAIDLFRYLRKDEALLERRPSLAELLNWLYLLLPVGRQSWQHLHEMPADQRAIGISTALLKNPLDQDRAQSLFDDWAKSRKRQ